MTISRPTAAVRLRQPDRDREGIVDPEEPAILAAWVADLDAASRTASTPAGIHDAAK